MRRLDVERHQVDIRVCGERGKRLLAMAGKTNGELALADLSPEALGDQQLEIGLVVNCEDLGGARQPRPAGICCNRVFNRSKSTGLVTNAVAPNSTARRRRSSSP